MAIDPICGMTVNPEKIKHNAVYQGSTYYFCSSACKETFERNPAQHAASIPITPTPMQPSDMSTAAVSNETGTAKDPICGMVVDKAKSLRTERAGRNYYFCSDNCLRTFESPETELKTMKKRVAVAMGGVLALAILRAGAFLALATGATIVSWAPIPQLPWFTWGVWLFILVTPVQFIGGWGFYKGAFTALKKHSINMDLLIALGTSVAYLYSVAVIFFPDVLPVKVEERDVYFEVSAVIIAFVLLGKYMEELIKTRASAAIDR